MQKVYLLLRSNKQTGPYSVEELLQLNLKPFDLVWVEGRSAAWQYPSEIPSLKPYVPETPQAEVPFQPIATSSMEEKLSSPQSPILQKTELPKRVFVSIPKNHAAANEQKIYAPVNEQKLHQKQPVSQEHRAYIPPVQDKPLYERRDEVRQNTPSYSQPSSHNKQQPVGEDLVSTNYSRSLHDVEDDYTNWAYKQKTKKKASANPKDLVLAILILAVIGGGYYVMSKPSVANSVLPTTKVTPIAGQPAANITEEAEPKEILSPEQKMSPTTNSANTKKLKNITAKNLLTVFKSQTNASVPQIQNSMPVEKPNSNIHNNDIASKEPEVKNQPSKEAPAEKKKKLGEVIKGIFTKKEKKEEPKADAPVLEDPKPATNRQATRRDNTTNPDPSDNPPSNEISTASLMEQIDLSSNAPENWMMGVRNLKITLKNRSSVTIQAASVTISYYDENNQLLEKKLIYFSNVAPKSKATAAAPDHKFADHVDFKLTTISAKEDRYARY